jgi:diaminopimelate epimerase
MKIPFLKMHGAANDFVLIDHREPLLPEPWDERVRRLCDRRRGVGADGVLLIERDREHDFAMRYFNADGQPAAFCGNGARCVARWALDAGLGSGGAVRFRTAIGAKQARRSADGRRIELEFGAIPAVSETARVEAEGRSFDGFTILAGVPHFVVPVERVEWVPVQEWGAALRHHPRFEPAGTNVDFVARLGAGRLAMRTYERGVEGETLACGSGALAVASWSMFEGGPSPVSVMTAGGDELVVRLEPAPSGWQATLIGPAEVSYRGEWLEEVPASAGAR